VYHLLVSENASYKRAAHMNVIFTGMYLSHLIFIEEGNKDFIVGKPGMINFNKRLVEITLAVNINMALCRRLIASVTAEIQQYQNEPYCLETNTAIQVNRTHFLL